MYCSDFFPIKTAKYAGNWDPKSKTLTYILQQKKYLAILFNRKHASTHLWRMEWTNKKL
jgi:hypothetical protein